MALDQIPQEEKHIGFKVCHNIVNAFVYIGKYRDAIQNYDNKTGFNTLLCYAVLGYAEKSKWCFTTNISLPLNQVIEEEGNFPSERNICKGGDKYDDLLE